MISFGKVLRPILVNWHCGGVLLREGTEILPFRVEGFGWDGTLVLRLVVTIAVAYRKFFGFSFCEENSSHL